MAKCERLFIGNLPENIVEQELKNEFGAYGSVQSVELKTKKDADDPTKVINTFAFLTLNIEPGTLKQCLQEFRDEKFRGRFLQVSVARENFLDKLKREREEAALLRKPSGGDAISPTKPVAEKVQQLPVIDRDVSSCSSDSSSSEDEQPAPVKRQRYSAVPEKPILLDKPDTFLARKKSGTLLENGRLRIDRMATGGDAIHIIEKSKKQEAKQFDDDKSKEADRRRMESLAKMKTSYDQKKMAIKNALKVDSTTANANKIRFSDAEDEPVPTVAGTKLTVNAKRKQPLFGDDDENDDDDFASRFDVKEEYQGVRGAKLQKLNARHKADGRFEMDASFLPDADENEPVIGKPIDDEREWQYGILERVIGHKLHSDGTEPVKEKNRFPQTIQRYDPTKQEHVKFLAKNQPKRLSNDTNANGVAEATGIVAEVSKEQFYKVSDNLASSLWSKSTGFSLLSMFGRIDANEPVDKPSADVYKVTPLIKSQQTKLANDMTNPFEFDSSDDERQLGDGKVVGQAQNQDLKSKKSDPKSKKPDSKSSKKGGAKLWHENFFFAKNDDRLKEGLTFFMASTDTAEDDEQNLRHKQQEMRNIIKKKIKRSIKSKLPHGAKPNRHFRRFTRNL